MLNKSKKLIPTLLAVALALVLFAAMPLAALAADATTLADKINNFDPGNGGAATGQLSATVAGSNISISSGSPISGVTNHLLLEIDPGLKILWKADYSGSTGNAMIRLGGSGTFDVADGGSVKNNGTGDAIAAMGANTVIVSGGAVSTAGIERSAIYTSAAGATVTVSSGTVSASAEKGFGICVNEANTTITVSSGTVSSAGNNGAAIYTRGAASKITVNGGAVKSTGVNCLAIYVTNDGCEVAVSGNATVESQMNAMHISGKNAAVKVSGGMVSTVGVDTGSAIYLAGTSADSSVTVSGGTVSAAGSELSHAICTGETSGRSSITVSGGIVKSVGEYGAIHIKNTTTTLAVSGGFVFGYGIDISGEKNVIYMKSGAPAISGTAVVCAWDKPTSGTPTYNAGTSDKLKISPADAAAKWDKEGSKSGIRYENGANKGFVEVSGVTVNPAPAFIVKFNTNGGSTISDASVTAGGKVTKPADPTKANMTFEGWYKEEALTNAYDFNAAVTADFTLYANWTTAPVVTSSGGSMANFLQVNTYASGMFTDVNESQWYGYNQQRVVARAYDYGLMKGNSATIFNPTGNVTVAEAITIAARVHSIYTTGSESFVQGATWYQVYVDYAIAKEIIAAGDFTSYTRAATRAEMAYIFSRSLNASEFTKQNTVNSLPDVKEGFSPATGQPLTPHYNAIITLYEAGVLTGSDAAGTFYPNNNITRAEAAAIISRVILPDTRAKGKTY